jgi:hypothetical protein
MRVRTKKNLLRVATAAAVACAVAVIVLPVAAASAHSLPGSWAAAAIDVISPASAG